MKIRNQKGRNEMKNSSKIMKTPAASINTTFLAS